MNRDLLEQHRDVLVDFVKKAAQAQLEVNKLLEGPMKNLESELKRDLVKACKAAGAYAIRHEDKYGLGRLDLSIKFPDLPHVLGEGKIVEHQKFAPTLRQWKEGEDYRAAGGVAVLIGWDKATKVMFVHEWAKEAFKAHSFPPGGSYKDHAETLREWLIWRATK
jgi:hypothetical protein